MIIPVWRDSAALSAVLLDFQSAPEIAEIIVSFAEPGEQALANVAALGFKAVESNEPNRGQQLDLGAAEATGAWLLFHHADTSITPEHLRALAALDKEADVIGGAFYRKFDERHPRLRCFEPVERWHNRTFGALYGDQSIFVRREAFHALGGFRGLPLMEDVDFSLRLRARGKIRLLDPPVSSSPRKHLRQGPWRTTFQNAWLLFLYHLGASPAELHRHYYRRSPTSGMNPNPTAGADAPAQTIFAE